MPRWLSGTLIANLRPSLLIVGPFSPCHGKLVDLAVTRPDFIDCVAICITRPHNQRLIIGVPCQSVGKFVTRGQ